VLAATRRLGAKTAPALPAPFHVPLFKDIVAELKPNERHVALDLGAASTEFLSLLSGTRSRVEIVDLAHFGDLSRLNETGPGTALDGAAETLLPRPGEEAIDRVFCWDLLNYLTLDGVSALMRAIGRRAAPGAVAHALIAYSDREMNACPARLVPVSADQLVDRRGPAEWGKSVASPRYSPEDLEDNMGGWIIDRVRLLSNGMQEYRLRF